MDNLTKEKRSAVMRSVKGKNTAPEMIVRQLLHKLGYRYRLHRKELPGSPDLVFGSRHKVVFVHGCYWHGHGCKYGQLPKTNLAFWSTKIESNRRRDERNLGDLQALGWDVLIVWQCETRNISALHSSLTNFLGITKKPIDRIAADV